MSNTYSTRDEAIYREIIEPLGDYASDFDVEAIADEILGDYNDGYACKVSPNEFWDIANLYQGPIEREAAARDIVPGERVKHKGLTLTRSIDADQYGWPAFEIEGKPGVSITLCPSQPVELA